MKPFAELKIVFFGTPDFAVASLAALVAEKFDVVAVVTAPDKPAGRGLQMHSTPVKVFADQHQIPVLQPAKLKAPEFIDTLSQLNADLHIVVAFRMLPVLVWDMPPMGTINVHGSLLPQYRGAAPINWAIIHGAQETGVTTFKLKHEIDTGNILLRKKIAILPEDNAGSIHDKLMQAGAQLLLETVRALAANTLTELPQDSIDEPLVHAPKIFKEDMRIHWDRDGQSILNLIRGLAPYPAAFAILDAKNIKVYDAYVEQADLSVAIGDYETDHKTYLRFASKDAWVYIKELQQEGKKRMDIEAFLRGFRSSKTI
ncbi:MAG: methionyl-tRNA formyltransferase [Phycisphaerales bacterium]|nr:methionyl-tRNA formyltransferase [Phycisphaerales bacterium]